MPDPTPLGARQETIERWLRSVGAVHEDAAGVTVVITPEVLSDFAKWVTAVQREVIAQQLEALPAHTIAARCADHVRSLRAEH
jgi:predicted amidohydrolase